jgi:hypothetical protein
MIVQHRNIHPHPDISSCWIFLCWTFLCWIFRAEHSVLKIPVLKIPVLNIPVPVDHMRGIIYRSSYRLLKPRYEYSKPRLERHLTDITHCISNLNEMQRNAYGRRSRVLRDSPESRKIVGTGHTGSGQYEKIRDGTNGIRDNLKKLMSRNLYFALQNAL